ncbi:unnamed protein product [Pleuronectes platessa]|uniref:WH2 domain-containing protein n=1 Tax=Pleuronectes platessa TaxID=8262 RepID=A0A9N7UHV7_PLEPL|nr:unnamed protein product [Pleuronectes platessa]
MTREANGGASGGANGGASGGEPDGGLTPIQDELGSRRSRVCSSRMPLPPPGGPLPPPTVSQANTIPPKLNREEVKGRGALLSDIAKSTKLRNVSVVNDCSAPLLDSKIQTPKSQSPSTEHPYIRLYQYLHQQPSLQGAASEEQKKMADEERSALSLESKTTNLL